MTAFHLAREILRWENWAFILVLGVLTGTAAGGAVGLVDVYSITGAVKVVKIGGKLPLESGYPLHGN